MTEESKNEVIIKRRHGNITFALWNRDGNKNIQISKFYRRAGEKQGKYFNIHLFPDEYKDFMRCNNNFYEEVKEILEIQ